MSRKENKQISKLIDINKDAVEFYQSAQEQTQGNKVLESFNRLESLHSGVIFSLQNIVLENGESDEDARAEETLNGKTTKLWGEMMAKFSNNVDETLVKHLEEAEDRCLHSMRETMEDEDITPETKQKLQLVFSLLSSSHDYMKGLKEVV